VGRFCLEILFGNELEFILRLFNKPLESESLAMTWTHCHSLSAVKSV
jgi:hypothetical protein